jgi:hypothetical protein
VREFAHTHVYDVSLLEHVGLDIELPTVIRSIGWGKLYDEPRSALGSCIGGYLGASHGARTSASTEFPYWYYPLERYISYGVDQAERMVEGIGWMKNRMDEFKHMQTEIHMSIDSQTGMLHNLFDHFSIDTDAQISQRFKLGGEADRLGMGNLSRPVSFPVFLVISCKLVHRLSSPPACILA